MKMPTVLGIDTKSAAASSSRNHRKDQGGKLQAKTTVATYDDASASRIIRYRLQRGAQKLLPDERVAKCHRWIKPDHDHDYGVDLAINKETGRALFSNVITCGSCWLCPVCAAKITEGRRVELQAAIVSHLAKGGSIAMQTLTYPHDRDLPLNESIRLQSKALRSYKADRQYKNIMKQVGSIGSVRSLEVTHGQNGWHPHTHDLIFLDNTNQDNLQLLEQLRPIWAKHVKKAGLGDINEHGFKINDGKYAAEYIAKFGHDSKKWSITNEITKSHIKKGRHGSRTPFDLLRDYLAGDDQSGALFVEFANQFKGKRQLYFSPGLKDALGIGEVTDQELADEVFAEKEHIGTLNIEQWKLVLRTNSRGEVLSIAERGGFQAILQYLERLRTYVPQDVPWYG
jgi:hypothetical protein